MLFDVFLSFSGRHRYLLQELVRRDLSSKYKGAYLGAIWDFLVPLLMLFIYSYVFGYIFSSRWSGAEQSDVPYPIMLFSGLIVFNFLAECINRAPSLVLNSPNLVKKTVFPLHLLPWMAVCTSLVNALVSVGILLVSIFIFMGGLPLTAVLFPLVLLPVLFLSLGASWILASLGVYVRDVAQVVGLITAGLLFLTPIFYPQTAVPQELVWIMYFNPLAPAVQGMREVLIWGQLPDVGVYLISLISSWVFAGLGLAWFQSTSEGFADVV